MRTPAPAPSKKTPMPAPKAPPRTPPGRPAIRHEMDEVEGEEEVAAPPPASRKKLPLVAGGAGAAVFLVALVVWGVTRSPSEPAKALEPRAERPALAITQPATSPAPVPAPPPSVQPRTEDPIPAPQPTPAPSPTAARGEEPAPPAKATAPPTPAPVATQPPAKVPAATAPAATKGVRLVKAELNSIPTPSATSGDGVLAVVATPWAEVAIDGKEIGETPREVRLGAGTYRVRAMHPALGAREQTVTIRPGKRVVWSPTFTN